MPALAPSGRYDSTVTLPRIPSLTTRVGMRADVDAIVALVAACELEIDGVTEVHRTDVEQAFDLAHDGGVIVAEARDRLAGWATLAGDRATVDVHPEWHGRGVGSALRGWTEARARAMGYGRIRQAVSDGDERANVALEAAGYRRSHVSWVLETARLDEPPAIERPPGIEIRPYRPGDARAVHRLIDEAFSEWPGREPTAFEEWSAHVIGHPAFAPELSRLAYDGDELVGAVLSEEYAGQDDGWVQQLATKATHRRRGIARALLESVRVAFLATGRHRVGLSTNSLSGALEFYERLGMRVRRSYTAWAKELTRG